MRNVILFCLTITTSFIFGQSGAFHLGIGKYSYTEHDQFAINFGLEKQLNKVFSLGLNGSIMDESSITYTYIDDQSPIVTEVTTTFGGFAATADLDIFVFALNKNKFQLHVGIGGGILAIDNDDLYGLARGYVEERVQMASNLSAGIGYSYGINLYDEEALQQFYFNVKRHF